MGNKLICSLCASLLLSVIIGCGGGNSGASNDSVLEPTPLPIADYYVGNNPATFTMIAINGQVFEVEPTMIVTLEFANNVPEADLQKLSLVVHIAADEPDSSGQEFKYV